MTRFTERVERDLGQIADRATPSSRAWEAIQQRIGEQDTTEPTMEVIMLAPDRNEPPTRTRTWMLVAAAIAALALIGGLIVAATRADEDPVPADEPEPTVPAVDPEPEPDAGADATPTSTFDGESCEYEGPAQFEVGSEVTFELIDVSGTESVGFAVWVLPDGMTAEEIRSEGITNNAAQIPESAEAEITEAGIRVTYLFEEPGLYAVNCADRPEGGPAIDYASLFTVTG